MTKYIPPSRLGLVCRALEAKNEADNATLQNPHGEDRTDELRAFGTAYGCLYAAGYLKNTRPTAGEWDEAWKEAREEFPDVFPTD